MREDNYTKVILLALLLVYSSLSQAQTSTLSPYSRFGPGELLFKGLAHQRAMGGTGLAESGVARFNCFNPASYAADTLMVFDFGISGEVLRLEQNTLQSSKRNAKIEYLVLGFPIIRSRVALAFGFLPFSGIGYDITSDQQVDSANTLSTNYFGAGGYNRYFLGTGVKITEGLMAGVNASYVFGSLQQSRIADFSSSDFLSTRVVENTKIGDFSFEFGLLYKLNFKNSTTLSLGATTTLGKELNSERSLLWENFVRSPAGTPFSRDTINYIEEESGSVNLPLSLAFGWQLAKGEHWLLRGDIRFQEWSKYTAFNSAEDLRNSFRYSMGGQYTHDAKGTRFIERMQFRAGVYFQESFLQLRNTEVQDMGLTIGFGLPLRKAFQSMLNIGLEVGQNGTIENNLIRERYFRLIFGITFNENWFQKRRYE